MTLRLRLFLVFGGLLALLVLAQYVYLRTLTDDLEAEVERVAVLVGGSVAAAFDDELVAVGEAIDGQGVELPLDGDDRDPIVREEIVRTKTLQHDTGSQKVLVHRRIRTTDAQGVEVEHVQVEELDGDALPSETSTSEVNTSEMNTSEMNTSETHFVFKAVPDAAPDEHAHRAVHSPHAVRIEVETTGGDDGPRRFLWLAHTDREARVPIPQEGLRERLARLRRDMLVASLVLLLGGLVVVAVVARRVTAPLQRLTDAADAVGAGALGTCADADAADREVRRVVEAFNAMSSRLAALDAASRQLAGQRQLAEIGEVARGLAHSLRNPLNALGLTVDELVERAGRDDESEQPEAEAVAATAKRQIRRLDRTVRSFLALTNRDDALVTQPVDLTELAHDVALEALHDAGGVRVAVDLDDESDRLEVDAVPAELRAAVQALVANAVEASPPGGSVRLHLRRAGARVRLAIEDDGSGLPDAVRARLFTPHTTDKAHGAGMGLFLAHRLAVHRYGGSLRLDDRPAGGTVAVLEIGDRLDEPLEAFAGDSRDESGGAG